MNARKILIVVVLLAVAASACASPVTSAPAPASLPAAAVASEPTKALPSEPPATTRAPATATPTRLPPPTPVLTVATTLDGLTTLPHRIQWQAMAPVDVSAANFYIDGQHAWKFNAHAPGKLPAGVPAVYGDNGQYLVTSFLTPGQHSFEARMLTGSGQVLNSVVTATVAAAPAPPDGLANTSWTRMETAADIAKSTSGQPGHPGRVGLTIDSVGWMFHDPDGGGLLFDVAYPAHGQVVLGASIEKPPYPNNFGGAFCDEPDPDILWSYTLGNGGKTLTLHPVDHEPCGDRLGAFEGTWTRQTK